MIPVDEEFRFDHAEKRTEPWPIPSEEDHFALALQFAENLCAAYGIETLRKIDEENKLLPNTNPDVKYDSVYDHIELVRYYRIFIGACDLLGFDSHNPWYIKAIGLVRDQGYEYWGGNYECQ